MNTSRHQLVQHLLGRLAKKQRKGFTLIELLVVVVIIGILASVALPSFVGAQDKARNSSVQANVGTVRMALEQYGTDNNGSYPDTGGWATPETGVGTNNYLPGNKMPRSPWSTGNQSSSLSSNGGLGTLTVPDASAVANGDSPSSLVNGKIGTGHVDKSAPDAIDDYGAVSYDYDSDTQTYVVYGTGKRNRDAILVTGVSNNGQ